MVWFAPKATKKQNPLLSLSVSFSFSHPSPTHHSCLHVSSYHRRLSLLALYHSFSLRHFNQCILLAHSTSNKSTNLSLPSIYKNSSSTSSILLFWSNTYILIAFGRGGTLEKWLLFVLLGEEAAFFFCCFVFLLLELAVVFQPR